MNKTSKSGPDFLCIGMQKGGTQWIYDAMDQLPGVFMPPIKEVNHFALVNGRQTKEYVDATVRRRIAAVNKEYPEVAPELRGRFSRAARRYMAEQSSWNYRQLFCMSEGQITGDVSPAYSLLTGPQVKKVRKVLPEARIVLSVRHPVARAWSHFNMKLRRSMAKDGISESDMHKEIIARAQPEDFREFLQINRATIMSSASVIHDRWSKHFDNVMVIDFTDIVTRPAAVVSRLSQELVGTPMQENQAPVVPNAKETFAKAKILPVHTEIGLSHFKEEIARCRDKFAFAADWESLG